MIHQEKDLTKISFLIFSILSFMLSVNMYYQLGSNFFEKGFFVIATIGLEFWKITSIIAANKFYTQKEHFKAIKKYLIYTVLAFLSVFAGYGYSLTATEHQKSIISGAKDIVDTKSNSIKDDIERYTKSINSNLSLIETNQKTIENNSLEISRLPETGYNPTKISLKNQSDKLIKENENLRNENKELEIKIEEKRKEQNLVIEQKAEEKNAIAQSRNMYDIIADATPAKNDTGNDIRYITLIIIAIMIEIGVLSNSSAYNNENKKQKKQEPQKNKLFSFFAKNKKNPKKQEKEPEVIQEKEPEVIQEKEPEASPTPKEFGVQDFQTIQIEKPKQDTSKIEFKIKKDKNIFKKFVNLIFIYFEETGGAFFLEKKELSKRTGIPIEKINHFYNELKDLKVITYQEDADVWIPVVEKEKILKMIDEY